MTEAPRTIVITGAGRGIGASIARAFAAAGDAVAVVDIDAGLADKTAAELTAAGHRALAVEADVTSATDVDSAITTVERTLGPVGVLVNNAGVAAEGLAGVAGVEESAWDLDFGVNVKGPYLLCRRVLPAMLERGAGMIVNIASVAGIRGRRAGAAYTASKHALIGLTRSITAYYGRSGVRCNAVCPGGVDSGFQAGVAGDEETAQLVAEFRASMPRRGLPEEVASIAVFLASEGASFMNGSAVVADAGWTAP
ncbi:SDR family oxidoreductase [Amycolatopsis acidicola]|uniref:SDR family oxidoreductase n=1 Tax=Amycolatopsis acidicola TaxID=2596893 RepID=A0A5N0UZ26_9PSEU|nr:SDR family oxidoreductase [Amycolatopsis acidicola]KAA9156740.1 SDR family oxidoreductase [Amycolatopsis acidicola]